MKSQQVLSAVLSIALLVAPLSAQVPVPTQDKPQPTPAPRTDAQEPEAVFRINTQLVQIDAVVTGKGGAHVDDLTADDFEVFINGKKQSLSYFKLVKLTENGATPTPPAKTPPTAPRVATTAIKQVAPEQVRRTVAFVVDDLGMSPESMLYARKALQRFVTQQMQDGDLVGIVRTGKGLGSLQQFTTDRQVLTAAIDKLTWNPLTRSTLPRFGQLPGEMPRTTRENTTLSSPEQQREERRNVEERFNEFSDTVFAVGTLGAVNFVVRGLRELPGRKTLILLSDGIPMYGSGDDRNNTQIKDRLERLTDLANRSSVVFYTIDTRGLLTITPQASDDLLGQLNAQGRITPVTAQDLKVIRDQEVTKVWDSQAGLRTLALQTGGLAMLNNNDLNGSVQKVIDDNRSYYLLGFDPDDAQFETKYRSQFHSIKVKVKRSDLQVRTRSGYFGVAETVREKPKTSADQILDTLFSPFGARDLPVQMTSLFFNTKQDGSFVRTMLHIDPAKLSFTAAENGEKLAKLEIATFTFDENGTVIESLDKIFNLKFDEARYQAALKTGMIYQTSLLIKKPGAYQVKTVLRDSTSAKLGSAGQFINVPNINKNQLALSGLMLVGKDPAAAANTDGNLQLHAAVRQFQPNSLVEYWAEIYNATLDKQSNQPQLTMQAEIYRDGKLVTQTPAVPVNPQGQSDFKRIVCGGEFRFKNYPPGDYALHLTINDKLAKTKYSQAEQWIDFTVR